MSVDMQVKPLALRDGLQLARMHPSAGRHVDSGPFWGHGFGRMGLHLTSSHNMELNFCVQQNANMGHRRGFRAPCMPGRAMPHTLGCPPRARPHTLG